MQVCPPLHNIQELLAWIPVHRITVHYETILEVDDDGHPMVAIHVENCCQCGLFAGSERFSELAKATKMAGGGVIRRYRARRKLV